MTVTPLLANQGFDQRQIEDMSTALIAVCSRLGLADHSDIVTDKVAKTIIELAQRGVHGRHAGGCIHHRRRRLARPRAMVLT